MPVTVTIEIPQDSLPSDPRARAFLVCRQVVATSNLSVGQAKALLRDLEISLSNMIVTLETEPRQRTRVTS